MYMELVMLGEIIFRDTLHKQLEDLRLWPKNLIDLCLSLLQLEPSCRPEASEVLSTLRGWIRGKAPEPLPSRTSSQADSSKMQHLSVPDPAGVRSSGQSRRRGSQEDSKSPARRPTAPVDPTSVHPSGRRGSREDSKSPLRQPSVPVGLPPRSEAPSMQSDRPTPSPPPSPAPPSAPSHRQLPPWPPCPSPPSAPEVLPQRAGGHPGAPCGASGDVARRRAAHVRELQGGQPLP